MTGYVMVFMVIVASVTAVLTGRISEVCGSLIASGKDTVELVFSMSGTLCLWSGIMKIAEKSGVCDFVARMLRPISKRLFKGASEKAETAIVMNISANLLGLGNAATPLGIIAMKELCKGEVSPSPLSKEGAAPSSAMINFVLINTVGLQIIPTTIASLRASAGHPQPFGILPKIALVSFISLIAVLIIAFLAEKLRKGDANE